MSINHFPSDIQETLLWPQQYHQYPIMENHLSSSLSSSPSPFKPHNPTWISLHHHHHQYRQQNSDPPPPVPTSMSLHSPSFSFNLNHNTTAIDDDHDVVRGGVGGGGKFDNDKEPMFEKPLTPSDVGKLNRLVIPKQYAEKYFPLAGTGDKGLLLSFEDESGKLWRFRYSYWNSSQSYVLTKGWSRYVKDKKLDAGDVVVFERHRLDDDRLFIGWKRRSTAVQDSSSHGMGAHNSSKSCKGWTRMFYSGNPYPSQKQKNHHLLPLQSHSPHAESSVQSPTASVGNSKILRLFGVNLECHTDESEPELPSMPGAGSSLSGQDPIHHHFYPHYSSPFADHMDFSFPQDIKQTRNHRG